LIHDRQQVAGDTGDVRGPGRSRKLHDETADLLWFRWVADDDAYKGSVLIRKHAKAESL
jgi:hypothetical protein